MRDRRDITAGPDRLQICVFQKLIDAYALSTCICVAPYELYVALGQGCVGAAQPYPGT